MFTIVETEHHEANLWIPLNERDPVEVASRCTFIGEGAQSRVSLLPPEYHYDAYFSTGNFEDIVTIQRAICVAHDVAETERIVRSMDIGNVEEQQQKVLELLFDNNMSTLRAIYLAGGNHDIDRLYGHPLLIEPKQQSVLEVNHMVYTQDYCRPMSGILGQLDVEHSEADFDMACKLVDTYADMQLFLCTQCQFDIHYKMVDNTGLCRPEEELLFDNLFDRFRLLDLGELLGNVEFSLFLQKDTVLQSIRNRDWTNIVDRKEYTQLHPRVQAYFNHVLETRLTEEAVEAAWPKGGVNYRHQQGSRLDNTIPSGLVGALLEKLPNTAELFV